MNSVVAELGFMMSLVKFNTSAPVVSVKVNSGLLVT
jgi:hypothetical protein